MSVLRNMSIQLNYILPAKKSVVEINKYFSELIAAGQDINERMPGNLQSPLMASCLGGNLDAAKALLELGADVTVPEMDGYTPMHGAGFQGRAEIGRDFQRAIINCEIA